MSKVSRREGASGTDAPPVAWLLLTLAPLFWAGNAVVARYVHAQIPPASLNFFRWLVALIILLPLSLPGLLRQRFAILRNWKLIALLGTFGVVLFQTLMYTALQSTGAINVILMQAMIPAVVVVLSRWLLAERVSRAQVAGVALSFFGVVVLVARGDPAVLLSLQINAGDLWMLAAVPCWALYTVLVKRVPPGLGGTPLLTATVMFAMLLLFPLFAIERAGGARGSLSPETLAAVLYVGLFPSVVAFTCWNRGIALVGPNRAGLFMHLLPVFGAGLAVLFLGESLHLFHVAGAALILGGIGVTNAKWARQATA